MEQIPIHWNNISLCDITNYGTYMRIGIRGLDYDILYINLSTKDIIEIINYFGSVNPNKLVLLTIPSPVDCNGKIILERDFISIQIVSTTGTIDYGIMYINEEKTIISEVLVQRFIDANKAISLP